MVNVGIETIRSEISDIDYMASRLPNDLVKYLDQIGSSLETCDDLSLALSNVYEEIKGHEVGISGHFKCSKVFEQIIRNSNLNQLLDIIDEILNRFVEISGHRAASHVLQVLLERLQALEAISQMERILKTINSNPEDIKSIVSNSYGSHIIRCLLNWGHSNNNLESEETRLCDSILDGIGDLNHAISDQSISPILQMILELRNKSSQRLQKYVLRRILDSKWLIKTSKDKIGSRFVEVLLKNDQFKKISLKMIKGKSLELLGDRNGNFVLQTIIRGIDEIKTLKIILSEISKELENSVEKKRVGVVLEVIRCYKRCESSKRIEKLIQTLILNILNLNIDNKNEMIESICKLGTEKYDLHGCLIASELMDIAKDNNFYVKSLLKIRTSDLYQMAIDKNASRVLSCFLSRNSRSSKYDKRLLKVFLNPRKRLISELALDKYGSHIVEQLWKRASSTEKSLIKHHLQVDQEELGKSNYGKIVLENIFRG
jgi:hypothetical protein